MEFRSIYSVRKEFTKEEFLRALLVELGTRENTPADVVNATLGQVTEGVREVLACTARVNGTCTASVGYDRTEIYYDTIKSASGQQRVKKTRTVTDWHPFSEDYSGRATCAAFNDGSGATNQNIMKAIRTVKAESLVPGGQATVSQVALEKARELCRDQVADDADIDFPGDRKKDVNYRSSSSILALECYKLPTYEVTYVYNGQEYQAYCFACGTPRVNCQQVPEVADVAKTLKEKTGKLKIAKTLSWWILAGVAIANVFLHSYLLSFASIAYLLGSQVLYAFVFNKTLNQLSTDASNTKLTALNTALEKHGFRALSQDESSIAAGSMECTIDSVEIPWIAIFICALVAFTMTSV